MSTDYKAFLDGVAQLGLSPRASEAVTTYWEDFTHGNFHFAPLDLSAELASAYRKWQARNNTSLSHDSDELKHKAAIADSNERAMLLLMEEFAITLPSASAWKWFPTKRSSGLITGVLDEEVIILCSDHLRAIFLREDGSLFVGHTSHFTGIVEKLYTKEKEKPFSSAKQEKPTKSQKITNSGL